MAVAYFPRHPTGSIEIEKVRNRTESAKLSEGCLMSSSRSRIIRLGADEQK